MVKYVSMFVTGRVWLSAPVPYDPIPILIVPDAYSTKQQHFYCQLVQSEQTRDTHSWVLTNNVLLALRVCAGRTEKNLHGTFPKCPRDCFQPSASTGR